MRSVTVRPVGDRWETWRALRLRALADAPYAFAETLEAATARTDADWSERVAPRPDRTQLIAEHAGNPVGMAMVVLDPAGPEPYRSANLYAMWVAPQVRRMGVARALLRAATFWARAHHVARLSLHVTIDNPGAAELYLSSGFKDTGTREPVRPGSTVDGVLMIATLVPALVMGVVNVTPDSFSDGGELLHPDAAVAHGLALIDDGADILDVGGEATNPRAHAVTAVVESARVMPVIERLVRAGAVVSIDTTKADVARDAVAAGASIINDISGGLFDPRIVEAAVDPGITYIAGHLRGRSLDEVFAAEAAVPWTEIAAELASRVAALPPAVRSRTWVDPGLGFGKGADPEANLELVRRSRDLAERVGCPVVIGASRKRFVHRVLRDCGSSARGGDPGTPSMAAVDAASVGVSLGAVRAGASVVRTHNVALLKAALAVYTKL
ncbi:MAG: dihydropteroate synthase [Kofleriaceae bacterium]